ncbi:hypothetical protein RZS08_27345, partial [Arthrospira platensis SPKY1]|nr:hypothetical protein [Arthrospira platensis SPKY1]
DKYETFLEHLVKYGHAYQSQKAEAMTSLFGDSDEVMIPEPAVPEGAYWPLMEKLNREKEVTGIYISGHPLDDYRAEIEAHTTCSLEEIENYMGREIKIAGIVVRANHRISKKGTGYGQFTIQDFHGSL